MNDSLMLGLVVIVGIGVAVALAFAGRDFIRGLKSGKAEFDAARRARQDDTKDQTPPRSGE
jgi:hypothetical protein